MAKNTIELLVKIKYWKIGSIYIIRTDVCAKHREKYKILKKIMDWVLKKYECNKYFK